MSETQLLLSRIAALRQQLEEACVSRPRAVGTDEGQAAKPNAIQLLEQEVAQGSQHTVILDTVLRQLLPDAGPRSLPTLPKQLTARARRILEQGRKLLGQLRGLADEFEPPRATEPEPEAPAREEHEADSSSSSLALRAQIHGSERDPNDPLARRYHETVALANTALRMIQSFPDAASAQLPLCQGLETILEIVAERIAGITAVLGRRRHQADQLETLAGLLTALHAKETVNLQSFVNLAEQLVSEAQQAASLRFLDAAPEQPARFVASHSLTVAQVMARLVRHDPDFRGDPLRPVVAALLFDVGMLSVPSAILAHPGPLDDAQRRVLEGHTRSGAELMAHVKPTGAWLTDVAESHHERLDGTGYPAGRQEVDPLTRFVAVCDVYAALCAPRPHRSALDTRTALTDTLLLAEKGALDRYHAERLLRLSFYPVGSVVELADGALGVVVATHTSRRDLTSPARPVLAMLTDARGQCLSVPYHLDLAECDHRSIVRTVPKAERITLLGSRYPEWE
jgi:HD-GYP domain-containing protein (c-di-GMP phosphodiesterase class II)